MSASGAHATRLLCLLAAVAFASCTRPGAEPEGAPGASPERTAPTPAGVAAQGALCEHGVAADVCTRCHPEFESTFRELGDWCAEHGVPESQCLECNPELANGGGAADAGSTTRVRLASAQTVREAGIRTVTVQPRRLAPTLNVVGKLAFNQNRLAELSSRTDALVIEAKVDVGDDVKKGAPLVLLASASVGEGQAQLASARAHVAAARAQVERERKLLEKGITSRQALESAEAALARAEAEQSSAGASLGAAGAKGTGAAGRYALTAPFDGTIVARNAVAGRSAAKGELLVQLADLSSMWALLEIPEQEASRVRPGQPVTLRFEGAGELSATLSRVAPSVDPHTRTVRARVELPNPERRLRAGAFVEAEIQLASEHEALVVPRDAVQQADGRTLVFVRTGEGLYEPVTVELGATSGELVEVVKGLTAGAEVVTTGAFLLKTEILKGSIGAGCCEEGGQ